MVETQLSKLNVNEINNRLGNTCEHFIIVPHLQMLYMCVWGMLFSSA